MDRAAPSTRIARARAGAARDGEPCEEEAAEPRPPALRFPQRGFGLHLIRLVIDKIDYERTPEGENVLVLTKHLRKGQEA